MRRRTLGRTGREVSEIGFGAWQIGADRGDVAEDEALRTLHAAADAGVTFFDTADVYGDGRSERLIGRLLREREGLVVPADGALPPPRQRPAGLFFAEAARRGVGVIVRVVVASAGSRRSARRPRGARRRRSAPPPRV
jgi:aryl-alcohol dehydrogenase-like predicted oxidoreductase